MVRQTRDRHLVGSVPQLDWHLLPAFSLACFALLGLEIASNVGGEIRRTAQDAAGRGDARGPRRAILASALPAQEIALVQGVPQAIAKMAGGSA